MMTRFIPFAVNVARITVVGKCDRYPQREKLSQRTGIGEILDSPIRSCYPRENNYSFRKVRRPMKTHKLQTEALYQDSASVFAF
jgi:hypothetical protein